jgi:hypothetical protein
MSKRNRPRNIKLLTDDGVEYLPTWCREARRKTYRDRIAADLQLEHIQLKARRTIHDEKRSYPCLFCRGWHLTSEDQRTENPRLPHSA